MSTTRKIASDRRPEFRRTLRNHPDWQSAKELHCPDRKDPSAEQWLAIADYLGVDTRPYQVDFEPFQHHVTPEPSVTIEQEPMVTIEPEPAVQAPKSKPEPSIDETAQKLADVLKSLKPEAAPLDEARVIELIKQHGQRLTTINVQMIDPATSEPTAKIEGAHHALNELVENCKLRLHTYLLGGAGGGKTTMAEQAAELLGLDFYSNGALLMKYEAIGHLDASSVFQSTEFRRAFENGGLYLFDEIDASSAEAVVAINGALANGSYAFPDRRVKRHADFVCVAAANTNGKGATREYVGRCPLDGASLDRFVQLEIDYDSTIEQKMGESEYLRWGGQDMAELNDWIAEVRAFRVQCSERKINVIVSPRAIQQGAALLTVGRSLDKIREATIYKHLTADQRAQMGVI